MKFAYRDYNTIDVNGMRFYDLENEKYYPSITTILGNTPTAEKQKSLNDWRNSLGAGKADAITEEARRRGTAVHTLAERYLLGQELEQKGDLFKEDDKKAFNVLKLKLKNIVEVWGQEKVLYSDVLEVAGRCDLICVYKEFPAIVDYKTARRIKNKDEIEDYKLQLAFYSIAHNEMFGTDIKNGIILMVSDGGFPLEFSFKLEEFYEPLIERVEKFYKKLYSKL